MAEKKRERFDPEEWLRENVPAEVWKSKWVTGPAKNLSIKKRILAALLLIGYLNRREITASIKNVLGFYEDKAQDLKQDGEKAFLEKALNDEALLKQRVQNALIWDEARRQQNDHAGQEYIWLPSTAEQPRHNHEVLYYKRFKAGTGDTQGNAPGEAYGCKCGLEWIPKGKK